MIVLINLNSYLGGGETLFVRMADYLHKVNIDYKLICLNNSYIFKDITKKGISQNVITISDDYKDFYYLNNKKREYIINYIISQTSSANKVNYVSFTMRDLYTMTQVTKRMENSTLTHLVLHYQDNLYVCQSILDKALKVLVGKEKFSRKNQILFNKSLLNELCKNNAIIPMSDLMVDFWNKRFSIKLKKDNVVALPTYDFDIEMPPIPINKHKIIWIGRIVDFKIPGLCVMLNFINNNPKYTLSVVGSGDMRSIRKYMNDNNIDTNRITFLGEVEYSQIGNLIKGHSIGYAMGTSIIEICRYGLPSIMALSTPKHQLFKRNICGGLYADCARGNVGDNLFAGESENNQMLLDEEVEKLENDFENSARRCYEYIKREYSFTENIQKYISIIKNSTRSDFSQLKIPYASPFRRFFKKYF